MVEKGQRVNGLDANEATLATARWRKKLQQRRTRRQIHGLTHGWDGWQMRDKVVEHRCTRERARFLANHRGAWSRVQKLDRTLVRIFRWTNRTSAVHQYNIPRPVAGIRESYTIAEVLLDAANISTSCYVLSHVYTPHSCLRCCLLRRASYYSLVMNPTSQALISHNAITLSVSRSLQQPPTCYAALVIITPMQR